MKILFVLEHYYPYIGGAEVLFKNVCEGLAARGHSVTVITTLLPGTEKIEVLNGVKIDRVNTPIKASRYWFTFLAIPLAIKLAGQSDIVHTTTYNGAFPARLASWFKRKKCIITVLEIIGYRWRELPGMDPIKAWFYRFLEGLIIRMPFNRYIAISRYTSDCVKELGISPGKLDVVYPGIDYSLFDPVKANGRDIRNKLNIKDEYIYLYYGRPGISKGLQYLVKAVPILKNTLPASKLLMIVSREPADGYRAIKGLIQELNLGENVLLIDPVPRQQLPSYIAAANCVVVPSLSEGFGFSAAEADAMQVPVIASDTASLPEVVSGSYLLVQPKSPQAIALALEAVYNNKMISSEKKTFLWADCIDKYENIYRQLSLTSKGAIT
jgi:D-inositol-3-phosphate glycosyltransferase